MKTKIREEMERRSIRQRDLASRTRIDKSRISSYVNGVAFPNAKTLARIARALGCKPNALQD